MNKQDKALRLTKAKKYAFLLLKYRMRSQSEICARLKNKKFNQETINEVISFLKEKKFIDDNSFARAWIEARLARPLGLRKIRDELKSKGVEGRVIEEQVRQATKDYSEERIVVEVARKRFDRLKDVEPQKARQRVFSYLTRRGFSPDIIIDAVNQLKSGLEIDEGRYFKG